MVVSLLTADEEADLDLKMESTVAADWGMRFLSFPIVDRQVPESEGGLAAALARVDRELASGKNVVLHCRQGIGRTGLVAACLLLTKGLDPKAAVQRLSSARGLAVPETTEQREWIDRFAAGAVVLR
jgi:protein-tyrosine phosphatase